MTADDTTDEYDIVIIGGGPAGLAAACVCAAAACRVLALEHVGPTGAPTLDPIRNRHKGAVRCACFCHEVALSALYVT